MTRRVCKCISAGPHAWPHFTGPLPQTLSSIDPTVELQQHKEGGCAPPCEEPLCSVLVCLEGGRAVGRVGRAGGEEESGSLSEEGVSAQEWQWLDVVSAAADTLT